jgi:ankyrin repeat protein
VNASDNEGKNAWYHAAFNHHDSVAKILVQHGATWQSIERRPQPEPLDVIDPKLKRSY